jgi:stage V sporulation protein B
MKKFSQALVWLTTSEIIFNLAAYIVHAFVGRILGPADYGRYGLVVTLTTMVIVLVGNGIPTAMSKYISEFLEKSPEKIQAVKRQALRLQVFVIGGITVIFFLCAPLIALVLRDPSLTPLFQISALIIPAFAAAAFYHQYFIGLHLFRLQAIVKIVRSVARVGFIVLAAWLFHVEGAVGGYILAPLFTFGAAILIDEFYVKRTLKLGTNDDTSFRFPAKAILLYAWPLTLFLVFYEFLITIDLYFVKALLQDDHLTGIYNAAITVGRIPYYLFYALAMMMLPAISKTTAERDTAQTESLVNRSLRLMTLLLFPMVTLLVIYAPQVLNIFYGNKFDGAALPMSIFAVGIGFLTIFYVLSFALNGAGRVKIPMWLSFWGLLSMIVLNLFLIPRFELIGAALSVTITSFVIMLGILIYTERHFSVRLPLKTILLSLVSAGAIVFLARFLPSGNASFFISGLFLFFLYFGLLKISGELKEADLAPLAKLFAKKY